MPEISFALIQSDNLKDKHLKVKQVECVIEVKGKLDPYQIQKIRDHVEQSFKDRQKTINDLIRGKSKEAQKVSDQAKRKKIIAEVDTAIARSASAFDKKVQANVTAFCEKDIEMQAAAKSGNWSYYVNTAWDVGSLLWNGSEALAETAGSVATGGLTAALALKSLLDLALDFEKFCRTQVDAWKGLEGQTEKLMSSLTAITKVKKGSPVPQSSVDKAETALAPLGPKIDVAEKNARVLSGKLDDMLKDKGITKITDKKVIAKIEKTLQAAVEELSTLGSGIAAARKAQLKAKDTIKSASAKAQADAWSYISWARGMYENFNDLIDLSTPTENLYQAAKQLKITVEKAMED